MDFLVDENLPNSLSEELRSKGFQARNIRELERKGDPDSEVFKVAVEKDAILITRDLEFGSPEHYDTENYEGLVIVRLDASIQASGIVEKTVNGILKIGLENLKGSITVLESGRYRTREI
ncbi:DUF5615 family PIN-like protein [Candidatus Nanohalobium constans]|uniref:DUF5615 domain-containing protein n=1 Tax=Candidatus Nanohalobium constans TaxID=2565781 RepID=A0A5Q0UH23_9ARCH|nr:DUF5615 family PIN-like protein [Candidatus Nanohalobium constans]QGA80928.1 hypothetical protein LC1Nh_1056 [Candidatus Nanohalobium constans]